MLATFPIQQNWSTTMFHRSLQLVTDECLQFIDLTASIKKFVQGTNVLHGLVNVQTRHTTTAIIINENEPLLLTDLKNTIENFAPRAAFYQHDDFSIRTENMTPDEKPNGHAHCKALFLRASETLNIVNGKLDLGRWQRIFLLELDCARARTVSLTVLGNTRK